MRASSSSMRCDRAACAGRVAGGAVGPGQLVELVEEVTGVADVAADGAVGPPHAVGVEAQVQFDELAHLLDVVGGVAQGSHPVARHPGAHELVVVEADRPPGPKDRVLGFPMSWKRAARRTMRLGPGPLHHGDGVREDVLVAVDRVLLQGRGPAARGGTPRLARSSRGTTGRRRGLAPRATCRARLAHARRRRCRAGPAGGRRPLAAAARAGGRNPQ